MEIFSHNFFLLLFHFLFEYSPVRASKFIFSRKFAANLLKLKFSNNLRCTVVHKCKTNVSFQNTCFFSKQCLSFRNTLLFLQNKLHSFQSKCFISKQMFHFKTNISLQNKCFISKQMFRFKTNVSFQNKCFASKQMFHFKTNVSFQNKCFASKQMFSFQNKCFVPLS